MTDKIRQSWKDAKNRENILQSNWDSEDES